LSNGKESGMNRSKETSGAKDGNRNNSNKSDVSTDSIEIELDAKQLRALDSKTAERTLDDDAPASRELIDTATNLELSQSLEDLLNLSWPGVKPDASKNPRK
jgi:hypothetical protein